MAQCLFCLEEDTENNILIKINYNHYYEEAVCTCKVYTHVTCWLMFITHKGHTECPICHKVYTNLIRPSGGHVIIVQNQSFQNRRDISNNRLPDQRCKNMTTLVPIVIMGSLVLVAFVLIFISYIG